ncbi:hypothetical protein D3C80_1001350 [compost metagenome]
MLTAAVYKRVDAHRHAFRVFMHQQFAAISFRGTVAEFVHLTEFPAGIHMQQRERQRPRIKRFTRQMQHHAGVFPDGIHHHGIGEFGSHLADDMNAFCFELPQVGKSFLVHNRSLFSRHIQGGHGGIFGKMFTVLTVSVASPRRALIQTDSARCDNSLTNRNSGTIGGDSG